MKAGFAKTDVTPPIGSTLIGYYSPRIAEDIITPLEACAVAISDGENTCVLISIDNLSIMKREMDIMKNLITKRTAIPYEYIFISCTHTHLGPSVCVEHLFPPEPAYTEAFFKKICDVAFFAVKDMREAIPHVAKSKAANLAYVRRFRMKDGNVITNPSSKDAENVTGPAGEADDELQLIKITRDGASDIAIVNFQVHPDVIGGNKICADYPGFLRNTLEASLKDVADGKGVKVVYFNGTQGDTVHVQRFDENGNYISKPKGGIEHSRHMGRVLAGAVMSIYTYAEKIDCDKVFGTVRYVSVESNKGTPEEVELAKKITPLYEAGGSNAIKEYKMPINKAIRILALEHTPEWVDVNISCVGFGDVIFVGFPGEPFTYVGKILKENSPFKMTLPCCLTGGSMSYFPTKDAFEGGGYETGNARFKKGIAETLATSSVELVNEIYNK